MMKKTMTGVIALAFMCSTLFLLTSCAKKQIRSSEGVRPTAPAEAKAPEKEVKKAATQAEKSYQEREKARQAKLKALREAQMISDFESRKIYFDFDKSELRPEAKTVLKDKAAWLRSHPAYTVRIEGNCDERGTNEYNLALGERRAHAAKKYLVALGVSEHRIATISYGEENPADPGHNEAAWAKNRRDEFKLTKRW